jgi:hypothetical protein
LLGVATMTGVPTVTTTAVAMHHMGATPETHHEIKERGEEQ